jgi:hypothetical protein
VESWELKVLRSETWRVAFEALWSNKLRAFLTTLGVVIGSACIVLVVTVAVTGRRYVIDRIESVGSNIVYANYEVNPQQAVVMSDEITIADMNALQAAIPNVVAVAGTRGIPESVVTSGVSRRVALVGTTEGFQLIRNLLISRGRFLDALDMVERSKVCLITQDLADKAFPNQDPIGQRLRVGEVGFTVIGVFAERVGTFGLSEIQQYTVLVPFPLMRYYTGDDAMDVVYAQALTPDPGRGAQRGHGAYDRAAAGGADRADRQRHRHHEHHAGYGHRAHPRNRHPQGHRRAPPRNPLPILDRGHADKRHRVFAGDHDRSGHSGNRATLVARQFARSGSAVVGGVGLCRGLLYGTVLRLLARQQSCAPPAHRIPPLRIIRAARRSATI